MDELIEQRMLPPGISYRKPPTVKIDAAWREEARRKLGLLFERVARSVEAERALLAPRDAERGQR